MALPQLAERPQPLFMPPPDLSSFELSPALEARQPPEARGLARDEVRLLVSYAEDNRVLHTRFRDLPCFLSSGDVLVINTSATLAAAVPAERADGTPLVLHFSTRFPSGPLPTNQFPTGHLPTGRMPAGLWVVDPSLPRPGQNPRAVWRDDRPGGAPTLPPVGGRSGFTGRFTRLPGYLRPAHSVQLRTPRLAPGRLPDRVCQ